MATAEAPRAPLIMLRSAVNKEICVETVNGDTYVGLLKSVDSWMNVAIRRSIRTTNGAEAYWSSHEVLVRGSAITNITVPDVVLDAARPTGRGRGRGGRGGRGSRGRGGDGRGTSGGERGRGRGAANRGGKDKSIGGKRNRESD